MARYLITGIAGFIGSTLAHRLVEEGHDVSGIDNLSTGRLENLEDIRSAIKFENVDLVAFDQVEQQVERAAKGVQIDLIVGSVGEHALL